ncbi:MAG TPA: hypothetical protein V6C81_31210 [Planktothrix sp.]|jgi:hypothetical protein
MPNDSDTIRLSAGDWQERAEESKHSREPESNIELKSCMSDPICTFTELLTALGVRVKHKSKTNTKATWAKLPLPRALADLVKTLEYGYRFAVVHGQAVCVEVEFDDLGRWTATLKKPVDEPMLYSALRPPFDVPLQERLDRRRVLHWSRKVSNNESDEDAERCNNCLRELPEDAPSRYCGKTGCTRSALSGWLIQARAGREAGMAKRFGKQIVAKLGRLIRTD